MQFSFDRKTVLSAVKKVAKIAKQDSPIKELSGILIDANADSYELSMTATDIENTLCCTLPVAVVKSGAAIVNAWLFHEMLSQLGADVVMCRLLDNWQMQLKCGDTECVIPTLPAKNYPKTELVIPENSVQLTGLAKIAKQCVFAVCRDKDNIALKCVNVIISQNSVKAMACDGTRMILSNKVIEKGCEMSFLIPADSFHKLTSMIEDTDEISVGIHPKTVVFSKQGFLFSARLVNAVYMDIDTMLQSFKPAYEALVGVKSLAEAIETVTAVGGENPINMQFQLGSIRLSCEGESGKSNMLVTAQIGISTPTEGFYFQSNKLLQSLKSMEGNIKLELSNMGIMLITTNTQKYMQVAVRPSLKKKIAKKTKKTAVKAA